MVLPTVADILASKSISFTWETLFEHPKKEQKANQILVLPPLIVQKWSRL